METLILSFISFYIPMLLGSMVGLESSGLMRESAKRGDRPVKTMFLMVGFTSIVSAIVSILFTILIFFVKNHVP